MFKFVFSCFSNTNQIKKQSEISIIEIQNKKKLNFENITGNFYVEEVYDGDTCTICIPIKLHIYDMITHNKIDKLSDNNNSNNIYLNTIKIRLYGIDSPEMKPLKNMPNREEYIKKAKEAKNFLSEQILGKIIRVEFLSNDKYGRPLVKIYKKNICLNELMIEKNYAIKYNGKTKNLT